MIDINIISSNLKKQIEPSLVDKLLEHYALIKRNFRLGKYESAELNGSKFSEMAFRILEFITTGKFTPLNQEIKRFAELCRGFEQLPKATFPDDTIRIHIPRTITLLVDIRNKRAVGHVSGIHSPNLMDSIFVNHCADWVLAELIRLYHGCTTTEAQKIVDRIVQIDIPLVVDLGDVKRVLNPKMKYPDQVLALLLNEYPASISEENLCVWTEHSNPSIFRRDVLKKLHKARKIEYGKGVCLILLPGVKDIEEKLAKDEVGSKK